MGTRLRLGRIDYINADPFFLRPFPEGIEVRAERPSRLNSLLLSGRLEASWISSIELLGNLDRLELVRPLCIAAPGPVRSVVLLSPVPLEDLEVDRIHVSSHSATSVALLRLLLAEQGRRPELVPWDHRGPLPEGPVLLIGDEALATRPSAGHRFVIDLAEEWTRRTGLPMVFAVLAARKEVVTLPEVADRLQTGVQVMEDSRREFLDILQKGGPLPARSTGLSQAELRRYFEGFCYRFDTRAQGGLEELARRAASTGILGRECALPLVGCDPLGSGNLSRRVDIGALQSSPTLPDSR